MKCRHSPAVLASFLLSWSIACATPVIDYQAGTDFSAYRTVQLGSGEAKAASIDESRVNAALTRELPGHGLAVVREDADLVLVTRFVEYSEYESNSVSWGIGGVSGPVGVGVSGPTRSREVKNYRLEIELVDRSANQVVWKARSAGALSESTSGPRRDKWIQDNVRAMLDRWPPEG